MRFLPRLTLVDHGHNNVLRGHEWKLDMESFLYHTGIHDESRKDVIEDKHERICAEEHLRDVHTPSSAVIKRALEPLLGVCIRGIEAQIAQIPADTAHALRAHWVTFEGHGGASYLVFAEWLF